MDRLLREKALRAQGVIFGEYHTNSNHSGIVTFIRFDTQSGIMAGTFEFQAQELITGEIINITEGRFDLTFIQ